MLNRAAPGSPQPEKGRFASPADSPQVPVTLLAKPAGPALAEYKKKTTQQQTANNNAVRAGKMCNVNALGVYVWETIVFFR